MLCELSSLVSVEHAGDRRWASGLRPGSAGHLREAVWYVRIHARAYGDRLIPQSRHVGTLGNSEVEPLSPLDHCRYYRFILAVARDGLLACVD